jgi:hypothetical protein
MKLLSEAMTLCVKVGISLDQLFDVTGVNTRDSRNHKSSGRRFGSKMEFISSLLFQSPVPDSELLGPPLTPGEVSQEMRAALGRSPDTMNTGYVIGRSEINGRPRFFVTPDTERDFLSAEEMMDCYRKNERYIFSLVFPKDELPRLRYAIGSQIRLYTTRDARPPGTWLRTKVIKRCGSVEAADVQVCLRMVEGASRVEIFFLFRLCLPHSPPRPLHSPSRPLPRPLPLPHLADFPSPPPAPFLHQEDIGADIDPDIDAAILSIFGSSQPVYGDEP